MGQIRLIQMGAAWPLGGICGASSWTLTSNEFPSEDLTLILTQLELKVLTAELIQTGELDKEGERRLLRDARARFVPEDYHELLERIGRTAIGEDCDASPFSVRFCTGCGRVHIAVTFNDERIELTSVGSFMEGFLVLSEQLAARRLFGRDCVALARGLAELDLPDVGDGQSGGHENLMGMLKDMPDEVLAALVTAAGGGVN